MRIALALALIVLVLPLSGTLLQSARAAASCTTECHNAVDSHAFGHRAPSSKCADCHRPIEPSPSLATRAKCASGNAWTLTRSEPDLCLACHEVQKKTALHGAIAATGCTKCHDPHGGDNRNILRNPDINALCGGCHDQAQNSGADPGAKVHAAITKKTCLGCHDPHSGQDAPLLVTSREALCESCHDVAGKILGGRRHQHPPAATHRCTQCHNPHASSWPSLLEKDVSDVCVGCHQATTDRPEGAARHTSEFNGPVQHGAITDGTCVDCHQPHASEYQRLLIKPQPALCHDCHARRDSDSFVHSAVRLGQCSGCHEPHSSIRPKLMRAKTSQQMCFICHADDLSSRANVHYPAKTDCMECHRPHGSDVGRNLRAGGKQLCYRCHEPLDTGEVKHPVIDKYGCVACHDPHGTDNRAYLIKPVNELCTTCHPTIDGFHVPNTITGHKLTGGMDPKRSGREFSCASCHNPHGSPFRKILYAGGEGMGSCTYCHTSGGSRVPVSQDEGVSASSSSSPVALDTGKGKGKDIGKGIGK